jgi:hypothetical protein
MGMMLKIYLRCADRFVNMLVATSDEAPQAMLVPEMVTRIAEALNYFLRHLTGPDRSKLSVSNPGKVCCCSTTVPSLAVFASSVHISDGACTSLCLILLACTGYRFIVRYCT